MNTVTLNKIHFRSGVWEAQLETASKDKSPPEISVRLLDRELSDISLRKSDDPGLWTLAVPIPTEAIGDGVHCFVIYDAATDTKLGDFTLIAGEPLAEDLRAEIALLRAELDMLKRAFRRHCLETT